MLQVNWHTVFWGIAIQWVLAVIILRTSFGLAAFEWVGDLVHQFLDFGLAGAEFVFGKDYFRHRVAMVVSVGFGFCFLLLPHMV